MVFVEKKLRSFWENKREVCRKEEDGKKGSLL